MKEKLCEICKEILKSEEETKKFSSYETLDELYEYFLKKLPGLTEEEFDEFVCEALDNYAKEKETIDKIKDGALSDVSGGAGFREKAVAGFLGLMSIFSSVLSEVGATNVGNEGTVSGVSKKVSETKNNKTKNPGFFKRTKEWIKKHPKLTVGFGIGALLLAGIAITLGVVKSRSAAKSAEEVGNPVSNAKDAAIAETEVQSQGSDMSEDQASPNDDAKPDKKDQVPAETETKKNAATKDEVETDIPVVTKDETKNSTEDSYAHEVAAGASTLGMPQKPDPKQLIHLTKNRASGAANRRLPSRFNKPKQEKMYNESDAAAATKDEAETKVQIVTKVKLAVAEEEAKKKAEEDKREIKKVVDGMEPIEDAIQSIFKSKDSLVDHYFKPEKNDPAIESVKEAMEKGTFKIAIENVEAAKQKCKAEDVKKFAEEAIKKIEEIQQNADVVYRSIKYIESLFQLETDFWNCVNENTIDNLFSGNELIKKLDTIETEYQKLLKFFKLCKAQDINMIVKQIKFVKPCSLRSIFINLSIILNNNFDNRNAYQSWENAKKLTSRIKKLRTILLKSQSLTEGSTHATETVDNMNEAVETYKKLTGLRLQKFKLR